MSRHPQSERFHALLREIGELHDKKQQDYGRADAPFANCQASVEWGTPGWVGTMIRANDKMRRLQKYATSGTLTNESARDSFLDLAVYTLIALCLWEDGERETFTAWSVENTCFGCDMDIQKGHNLGCPSADPVAFTKPGYVPAA